MNTAEYDFYLPENLIAQRPHEKRDCARLLVLQKRGHIDHKSFSDIASFIKPGDMLIVNNTKVFPARLTGYKPTGGKVHVLLISEIRPRLWTILMRERYSGPLNTADGISARITDGRTAEFENVGDLGAWIWKNGEMPLPPYIKRQPDESDKQRYQTVYAEIEGSIAAPTAGLHFTPEILSDLVSRSVSVRSITLHVGTGTFRPVKTLNIEEHSMDSENFQISTGLVEEIRLVKERGNRIIAVGTTTTRALEGYFSGRCTVSSRNGVISGSSDIFIYEGYQFRVVDALITNFHLPRSTPLMLTAVLAGRKNLMNAYAAAISLRYRFFSYGDAMLVL